MGGSGGGIGAGTTTVVPRGRGCCWVASAVPAASAETTTPPVETAATAGWCGATVAPAGAVAPAGRAASATAVRVATRHCCSATAGRAGPAAPAASVPAEAGGLGAAAAPGGNGGNALLVGNGGSVRPVPVGLLAVPAAQGSYSAKWENARAVSAENQANPGQCAHQLAKQAAHIYWFPIRGWGLARFSRVAACMRWLLVSNVRTGR